MHVEDDFATTKHSMIESVLTACDEYNIDPIMIDPLINRSLKEKLKVEYISLNFIKQENNVIV